MVLQSAPARFRIGPQSFLTFDYATLDTSRISARYGTSIAGAIGYSMLRDLHLMVDFSRGLVKLSPAIALTASDYGLDPATRPFSPDCERLQTLFWQVSG